VAGPAARQGLIAAAARPAWRHNSPLTRYASCWRPILRAARPGLQQEVITMANEGYHEPVEELSDATRDMHRAIISLMEELEAVDWYNQRVDACRDPELKSILAHNRDEEKEHAAMVLEWIRRRDPSFDKELKDVLFSGGPIGHH